MLVLRRWMSKYACIQEMGKFPSDVQRHLTALGDIEWYKSYMGLKPVKTLDLLYRTSKRKMNISLVNWQKYPEIQVLIKELPSKLETYPLENVIIIMKSLAKLSIFDEKVWKALEKSIILKCGQVKDRQLYDIISCFSKSKHASTQLWKELENVIINEFCPKHNMQAIVIAQIIGVFYKANILTAQFLTVLEQQILRPNTLTPSI